MVAACKSRTERWNLAGATALVTGGRKGIGYTLHALMICMQSTTWFMWLHHILTCMVVCW